MTKRYDLVVIGGGAAGIVSSVMAGGLHLRVLMIEKDRIGGECLYTGCVPSKALLHAAHTAHKIRHAAEIGLKPVDYSRQDTSGVMKWVKQSIKAVANANQTEAMLHQFNVEVRRGDAHFTSPHTVQLDGDEIYGDHFVLATGSHPDVPEIPGLQNVPYLTNTSIFDLTEIPESLLIIGGGPIGVEMAQAFSRLGSKITLVQRNSRIVPREDARMALSLQQMLQDESITILCGAQVTSVTTSDRGIAATVCTDGGTRELVAAHILCATGRRPNVEGLKLENAGVKVTGRGIPADSLLRTCCKHIYVAGDLLGDWQYSHMAEYEAKLAVRNILFPGATKAKFKVVPRVLFTEPELASVGLTEEEATAQNKTYRVYQKPFTQDDRAITDNAASGEVKVLAHPITGHILGAHILGPRAGELIMEWLFAMEKGHPIMTIADMTHPYPTLTMASQRAAQKWYEELAKRPVVSSGLDCYVRRVRPHTRAIAATAAIITVGAALLGLRRKL